MFFRGIKVDESLKIGRIGMHSIGDVDKVRRRERRREEVKTKDTAAFLCVKSSKLMMAYNLNFSFLKHFGATVTRQKEYSQ